MARIPKATHTKGDGWTCRPLPGNVAGSIFVAPDGQEYARATARERPDLILRTTGRFGRDLPDIRLRRWERSAVRRSIDRGRK
jgi:hypothetical protein